MGSLSTFLILSYLCGIAQCVCPNGLGSYCNCEDLLGGFFVQCNGGHIQDIITGLQKLRVDRLRIIGVNTQVLKKLPDAFIRSLHIVDCNVSEVEPNAFHGLSNSLEELVFANNSLQTVPLLGMLPHLRALNLNNNQLTDIAEHSLEGIVRLKQLRVERNNICSLSRNALNETKGTLELLDLSDNCLSAIPAQNLRNSPRLMYLDLSDNRIKEIDKFEFMNLPMLKELRLNNNLLLKIASMAFMNVPQLQYLYMKNNSISRIESDRLFQVFKRLEILDLSMNRLTKIPSFKDLSQIRQVRLDYNEIDRIETLAFSSNKMLQLISLKNNKISVISKNSFYSLDQLGVLLLANNSIRTLERGMLDGMTNLQQLNLRNNSISELDGTTFASVPLLTALDLAHNGLTRIARETFLPLFKLFWLDLSYNHLSTFEKGTFVYKISNILFHGNPLDCDDRLDWMVEYLVVHQVRTFLPYQPEITCTSPKKFAGVRLKELMIVKANATLTKSFKVIGSSLGVERSAQNPNFLETLIPGSRDSPGSSILSNLPIIGGITEAIPSLKRVPGFGLIPKISDVRANENKDLNNAIEQFSAPLVRMASGGQPEAQDIEQMMKSIPALIVNVPGLGNIDVSKLPPGVISHILRGGQIPGIPKDKLDKIVKEYMQKMHDAALAAKKGDPTPEQTRYLPPIDKLPIDFMSTVMQGDSLPHLTKEQTTAVVEYYTSQLPLNPGKVEQYQQSSDSATPARFNLTPQLVEMAKLLPQDYDITKIPAEVLSAISRGEMPDLQLLPPELQRHMMANSQRFFATFVKSSNISIEDLLKKLPKFERPEMSTFSPYDINEVSGDVVRIEEDVNKIQRIQYWTAIILGLVAAFSLSILCLLFIYMKRKRLTLVECDVDEDSLVDGHLQLPPPQASSSPKDASSRYSTRFLSCRDTTKMSHNI